MAQSAKVLILNDQVYVSPYLMRPLRRLDEVERSQSAAETDGAKKPRRQADAADGSAPVAAAAGGRGE